MKMYSFIFLFVISLQIFFSYVDSEPCPFNKACTCIGVAPTNSSSLTFQYVRCKVKDGKLPQFDPAPEGKYHINYDFDINDADLKVIPAKHFAAFEYIGYLHLNHKNPLESTAEINWDDGAFEGVQMVGMFTSQLDGLIPAPAALKNTGSRYLYIFRGRKPISMKDDSFKNLPSLESLTVDDTTIHEIKPNAFSGLEDKLEVISLKYAHINDLVSLKDAIKNMKKLDTLDLSYNDITEINSDTFPEITLHYLNLTDNWIKNIDKKSFIPLKELRVVSLDYVQTLESADLATFSGLNTDEFTAKFTEDTALRSVVVSDAGDFAKKTTFDFGTTGLTTIDPKVADLLDKYPGMFIYFDNNRFLKCDGLEWMSKIECPARMLIDDTVCADTSNQRLKLAAYLRSVDPESKCKESLRLPRLLQNMRGNLTQERQHRYRRQF